MANDDDKTPADPFEGFVTEKPDADDGDEPAKKPDDEPAKKPDDDELPTDPPEDDDELPTDPPDEDEDEDEDDEPDAAKKAEYGEKVRTRIAKVTKARREAERRANEADARATALEQRLAALEAKKPADLTDTPDDTTSSNDKDAPDPTKYTYGELDAKFIRDTAKYHADKRFDERQAAADKEAETRRQTETTTAAQVEFAAKTKAMAEAGAAKYEDFEEVVLEGAQAERWQLSQTMGDLIVGSKHGADIAYYLASNPKIARELYGKPTVEQAATFGRLEARFASRQSAPNKASKAPPPPKNPAKGGSGKQSVGADTEDFSQFEALAMKKG